MPELKRNIESGLAEASGNIVKIGSVELRLPLRLYINEITISSPETSMVLAEIETLRIAPEAGSFTGDETFSAAVSAYGVKAGEVLSEIDTRIHISKKANWRSAIRSPEIKTIDILGGNVTFQDHRFTGLSGTLDTRGNRLNRAKVLFAFEEDTFLLDIESHDTDGPFFSGTLRSGDYTLRGSLFPESDTLSIERFVGTIFSIHADVSGKVEFLSEPGRRHIHLEGYSAGKLLDLLLLAFEKEQVEAIVPRDSVFTSKFSARSAEDDIGAMTLSSGVTVSKLSLGDIEINDISGSFVLENGQLSFSDMMFFLGPHPVELSLGMNIHDENFPLVLEFTTSDMDITAATGIVKTGSEPVYGPLDLDVKFSGNGKNLYLAADHFIKTGVPPTADMEIFHDMKMSGALFLELYRKNNIHAENISAAFSLDEGFLEISKLSFESFGGFLNVKGSMSFLEEGLASNADISIKELILDDLPEGFFGPGNTAGGMANAGISFRGSGKLLLEFLRDIRSGSGIKKDDKNLSRRLWSVLLSPEYRYRSGNIYLNTFLKMERLGISGIEITDIDAGLIFDEGIISSPSLSFSALGGSLTAKTEIRIMDDNIPLNFETYADNMRLSKIPRDVIPDGLKTNTGTTDLRLFFNGSGDLLSKLTGKLASAEDKDLSLKSFWRTILLEEFRSPLSHVNMSLDLSTSELHFNNISAENVRLKSVFENSVLRMPLLSANLEGGTLRAHGFIQMGGEDFPAAVTIRSEDTDLSAISRAFPETPVILEGPSDAIFSFSGHGRVLTDAALYLRGLDKEKFPETRERLLQTLLFISRDPLFIEQKLKNSFFLKTLRVEPVRFQNVSGNIFLERGKFLVPALTGTFYRGTFSCDLEADLTALGTPFTFNGRMIKSDLRALLMDGIDPKSPLYGNIDINVHASGRAQDQYSYSGYGSMSIYDADLGRIPILTPLLGWIYEGLEDIFPAFRKININSAWATFEIRDRKIITDDLILSGTDICLVAEGAMDFDGKLDFYFENELIDQKLPGDAGWPVAIRNLITNFGRTISRARLRGSLGDQKWDFEYLTPTRRTVGDHLRSFFEGLSR